MVSQKALQEFKKIWEEECGIIPSDDFAMEKAVSLLTFIDAVYKPIKKEWVDIIDKNDDLPIEQKENCRLVKKVQ